MTFFVFGVGAVTIFVITPLPVEHSVKTWAEYSEIIRNYFFAGAGLGAATIGLYLAWVRTKAAADQAETAQRKEERETESQRDFLYTQSFTRSIEQLGSADLSIRLGGIYALERIAKESEKDHWSIMEVLTAYIRENAPWPPRSAELGEEKAQAEQQQPKTEKLPSLRADVQAILTLLGRRNTAHEEEDQHLNLCNTDLRGANVHDANLQEVILTGANLQGAILPRVNLQEAILVHASLENAILQRANLRGALLNDTNLCGADLVEANLEKAVLISANLQKAVLARACLNKANLQYADLKGANLAEAHLHEADVTGADMEVKDQWIGNYDPETQAMIASLYRKIDLRGADLSKVIGLTETQLRWAEIDEETMFPNHISPKG